MAGYFELKKASNGKFMFNLKAGNNQVVLTSETYSSKDAAEGGIASVKKNAVNASLEDTTRPAPVKAKARKPRRFAPSRHHLFLQ